MSSAKALRPSSPPRIRRASGNVFRDLGFDEHEAHHLQLRSLAMAALCEAIAARGLTQAEAARVLGVSQPRVSTLVRGRIELFSLDTLVQFLRRLGLTAELTIRPSGR